MGEVFAGRYELVDPIGRGGVGAVWRAWDHRRRRYVAAKVLQQSDAHSLLRFVREQALRIDHPHVLAPASWAADDDKVLFTMDLVGGGSLVHLIGDYGPLPPAFVCTLLDQLLAGLAAVHAEGVVHRDIKPANILLEATGTGRPRLRLSDFGISMRLGEPRLTETNYVVGTPGYFAPEQLLGSEPDFPADLFAVGLVALYLLEGAKPDAKALVDHFTVHGTPGAPKGIPEPLWQIVATLLQPDPQARFRTATGARKALAAARELLPEPGPDDELIEIFEQLGPIPAEFGPQGPLTTTAASGGAQAHDTTPQRQGPGTATPSQQSGAAPASARTATEGRAAQSAGTAPSGAPAGAVPPQAGTAPEPRSGGVSPDAHTDTAWPQTHTGAVPPMPPPSAVPPHPHTGADAVPSSPTPGDVPPPPSTAPVPPQSPATSDTGGFPLQPHPHPQAQAQPEQPPTPPTSLALPNPAYSPHSPSLPYDPSQVFSPQAPHPSAAHPSATTPVSPHQPHEFASTASYTAQDVRVPPQPQPVARHRARRAQRRPGPPAMVAVPVLMLALACFAVGFWALTQI
ncbi:protein kinase [Streptomyces phaeochromogenes]|uniref:serine/threonine-protein kinase n=1 Tax=Streptomyces phaeochromogenes TaxID=1923 RepID=UPI00225170E7|nr:serine/threonine protein kinase [Streptomyces phaeochromogenes]MCX5605045.1 protein kinase [Streptomyces phaeochromogenes]